MYIAFLFSLFSSRKIWNGLPYETIRNIFGYILDRWLKMTNVFRMVQCHGLVYIEFIIKMYADLEWWSIDLAFGTLFKVSQEL